MSLSATDIQEIMRLFDGSHFHELKLDTGEVHLHLRKTGAPVAEVAPAAPPRTVAPPQVPAAVTMPPPGPDEADLLSPLLGIFYRAPKPGEPPFIECGSTVAEDTIIGIVEVMKLMNPVRAGLRGEVIAIHVANAEMVEYDQPLIRVKTAP